MKTAFRKAFGHGAAGGTNGRHATAVPARVRTMPGDATSKADEVSDGRVTTKRRAPPPTAKSERK